MVHLPGRHRRSPGGNRPVSEIDLLRAWLDETRNTPEHRGHKLTISASRHWQTVNRLLNYVDPLEAIVRDLAAREPLAQLGDTPYHDCSLCGAHNDPPGQPYTNTPPAVIHDEACPHRRAKEWVEAHP